MNVDTLKIKECGKDILKLSYDLKELHEVLYERIKNMSIDPSTGKCTGEWQGLAAKAFSKKVELDKAQIVEVENTLNSFGNLLIQNAENYENRIKKTIGE